MSNNLDWPGADKFGAVQDLLDRNKLLINQISANHAAKTVESLTHNKVLIKELNNNVARVVELYRELGETLPLEAGGATAAAGAAQPPADQGQQQQQPQQQQDADAAQQ
jgi:hypothetical protein